MTHWNVAAQFLRFGIAGALLTGLVSVLYLAFISWSNVGPAAALTISTAIATITGFFFHSSFTFRNHGQRDHMPSRFGRFIMTNTVGYLVNLLAVYLFISVLSMPDWTPILAFFFIAPLVTFQMNRGWVFR